MPQGRILLKSISTSKKLPLLGTDGARLLYTWLIPHVDVNGCFSGDPEIVKGKVFTKLRKSTKSVGGYLQNLADIGLIILYEADGENYLHIPDFVDKQPSLNPDREAKTTIPMPTQDQLQTKSGLYPLKVKESKVKLSKDKYGEFVLLSKDQYQELVKKLTKPVVDQLIVDLNLGIGTHGYKYKSHYHVIQTWHRKNLKSKGGSAVPQEKLATPICLVCKATGRWYKTDRQGKPVYLCPTCAKALATVGITNWGYMKKSSIEKSVECGKAMLATRSTPAEPTHEASVNDKRNAAAKLIAETTKNFGKV